MLMAQEEIARVLEECLLTDSEMDLGQAAWAAWACPWDTLLLAPQLA